MMKNKIRVVVIIFICIVFFGNIFLGWNAVSVRANQPPIAVAGPDQNKMVNQTVYLSGSGSYDPDGDPVKYFWDFGDGVLSDQDQDGIPDYYENESAPINISHTYSAPGDYIVTLTVTDGYIEVNDTCIIHVNSKGQPLANSPWPCFRGNLKNTGLSTYSTSMNSGKLNWSIETDGVIRTAPVIGPDGTIYICSFDKLYAISANGTQKWTYKTNLSIMSTPAIDANNIIYFGSRDKNLYAINSNGKLIWKFQTGDEIYSSPTIDDNGIIYIGSNDKKLYAINPDGTENWNFSTGWYVHQKPSIGSNGIIYTGSLDGKLYAIAPNGTEKWNIYLGSISTSSAIGKDGTVYIGSWGNKLHAINQQGVEKWNYTFNDMVFSSPAIDPDGTLYIGCYDHKLYAIDRHGTLKWRYSTSGDIFSSPVVCSNGLIYFGSNDYNLYSIYPNGTKKWSYSTLYEVEGSPAIGADGTIYVGSEDSFLYAIKSIENKYPIANAGPNQNATVNQIVNFTGSSSYDPDGDPLTYNWDFGDGITSGWQSNPNASHSYSSTGNYNVILTVTDGEDQHNDTCVIHVTEIKKWGPEPIITFPNFYLDEDSYLDNTVDLWEYFQDHDTPTDKLNFSIVDNRNPECGINIDSNRYIDIYPVKNWFGSSNVTIKVSDGEYSIMKEFIVYVMPVNDLPIADAGPDKYVKVNETVYFDGSGSRDIENDNLSFKWEFWDDTSRDWQTSYNVLYMYSEKGTYTVTLFVTDGEFTVHDNCTVYVTKDGKKPPDDNDTDDKDGDGLPDTWELDNDLDPNNANDALFDNDGDTLTNLQEFEHGTNPNHKDTDGDSILDGWEVLYGLDPTDSSDAKLDFDNDTLPNSKEHELGTNPLDKDTDGDGYTDNIDDDPVRPFAGGDVQEDDSSTIDTFLLILIGIIIIIILIVLTAVILRSRSQRAAQPETQIDDRQDLQENGSVNELQPEEEFNLATDEAIIDLQNEALTPHKPSDLDISDQELLTQFEAKRHNGKISQETYDLIQDKLGNK
jgi:outer membrane protein assembly factor BamB